MKGRRDPDLLTVYWSEREQDLLFNATRSWDGGLTQTVFCGERMRWDHEQPLPMPFSWDPSFVEELKRRGYDIRTLKFSVRRIVPRVYQEVLSAQAGKGE